MRSSHFRIPAILLLSLISLKTMAQSEQQQKTDSVFRLFKVDFNSRQVDKIYSLMGNALKEKLDYNTFKTFYDTKLAPLGEIKKFSPIDFVNNKIATYKVVFSYVTLQLLLSIDEDDKLDRLLFQPFTVVENKSALVPSTNPLKTITDRQVDTLARTYIQKQNTVGLSIAVFKGGTESFYGYGETARENDTIPAPNTIFEIGSITKTFTGTLLAWYVNEGKIKLTDPISKFLPDSVAKNPALKGITLVNLSNHTSGLPSVPGDFFQHASDPLNPYKDYTREMLYSYLKTCKPDNPPGEKYEYSNMAVTLLGLILEQVAGKNYDEMVTDMITGPLHMNNTAIDLSPQQLHQFARVYNTEGKLTPAWDLGVFAPAGAIRSSAADLMIYARANMRTDDSPLSKAFSLAHQVTYSKNVKISLNWHIIVVDGVSYYFHDGGTAGSSSFLAFNTEKNIAVVILSNCGESTDKTGVELLKKIQ